MGLFNLFKQNDFSDLEQQGGIKLKYQKLIRNIENLSKEKFLSMKTYDFVDLNHKMNSVLLNKNEYEISITFQREGQISINKDVFKLIHKNQVVFIDFSRESKAIISFLPSPLPPLVKMRFEYSNSQDQDVIFINLLSSIESVFNKQYKYTDTYYKKTIENLNE